jgi:hypothetical protein
MDAAPKASINTILMQIHCQTHGVDGFAFVFTEISLPVVNLSSRLTCQYCCYRCSSHLKAGHISCSNLQFHPRRAAGRMIAYKHNKPATASMVQSLLNAKPRCKRQLQQSTLLHDLQQADLRSLQLRNLACNTLLDFGLFNLFQQW